MPISASIGKDVRISYPVLTCVIPYRADIQVSGKSGVHFPIGSGPEVALSLEPTAKDEGGVSVDVIIESCLIAPLTAIIVVIPGLGCPGRPW